MKIKAELLRHPIKTLPKLYWRIFGGLHSLPFKFYYGSQYDKIHEDLLQEDKFLLIILDACRTDYFIDEYNEYMKNFTFIHDSEGLGSYEPVYSSGSCTFQYVENTWHGNHQNIKYLSSVPLINSKGISDNLPGTPENWDFDPGEHLDIVDLWDSHWSKDLGTVHPSDVTNETKKYKDEDKLVSHYIQPHIPYIGQKRLGKDIRGRILSKGKTGEITVSEVRKAYRSNLRLVLSEVTKLIKSFDDRRIVITADHGELLGEGNLYSHPHKFNHPVLRTVPWFEVKK